MLNCSVPVLCLHAELSSSHYRKSLNRVKLHLIDSLLTVQCGYVIIWFTSCASIFTFRLDIISGVGYTISLSCYCVIITQISTEQTKMITAKRNDIIDHFWWTIKTLTANENQLCFKELQHWKCQTATILSAGEDANIVIIMDLFIVMVLGVNGL